jgi:hypothetical protein
VFVDKHAGNRTGADAISDDSLLEYWRRYAGAEEIEARTFRGVYDTARRLIAALDAAAERHAGRHAKSIGTDVEAGEVDPADLDAVISALDADEGPLSRLLDTCGEQVKIINLSEAETLGELPLGDGTARRIPVSVLRNAVFGAVQLRLSTALRRGDAPSLAFPSAADGFYRQKLQDYADIVAGTEKIALAALWGLHQAGRAEAVELALALAPDIDWDQLSVPEDDGDDGRVVSLQGARALSQFLATEPDPRGDEPAALLAEAKRAWRGVNRTGFRGDADAESIDAMARAVPDVLRLIGAVRRTLDRDLGPLDWPSFETADAAVFTAMFATLYDLEEEADNHAG